MNIQTTRGKNLLWDPVDTVTLLNGTFPFTLATQKANARGMMLSPPSV
ncbi:hypothetical protein MK805_07805 [Shimazuella sp. AN120528]|nr:hypothetical protein [Shimazuella soli]MCH5584878.1 hypothetical protein [Shimazuella soli]